MKNAKLIYGLAFGAMFAASGAASAAITSPVVVDFGYKPDRFSPDTVLTEGAYYGKANTTPNADGTCVADCVYQNGMVVGTVEDPTGPNAHLHQGGSTADRELAYHNDSGGVYIRALDSSAFSLDSIEMNAPINGENPYDDPQYDYYEILGFSTALNPGLSASNGTDWGTRVAYQTVLNGTSGTVMLNDLFKNVAAVWIHYAGVPNVGAANFPFKVQVDNIAVSQVAAVPVPAAVWLFGSGLMGLLSLGRKKAVQA
ncbi:MAG: hypothetical protein PHR94_08195 [Methylomonas lenta]|nr:hypothetical protein [Methylomonas lenta]